MTFVVITLMLALAVLAPLAGVDTRTPELLGRR
jgi:hypothetical protein